VAHNEPVCRLEKIAIVYGVAGQRLIVSVGGDRPHNPNSLRFVRVSRNPCSLLASLFCFQNT
jgi:hypothetical protein